MVVYQSFRKLRKSEVSSQSKSFGITCFNLWLLLLHPWWPEQACLSHHLLLNCVNCIPVNPYYPQTFIWYLSAYFSIALTEISVFQSLLFYLFNILDLSVYMRPITLPLILHPFHWLFCFFAVPYTLSIISLLKSHSHSLDPHDEYLCPYTSLPFQPLFILPIGPWC